MTAGPVDLTGQECAGCGAAIPRDNLDRLILHGPARDPQRVQDFCSFACLRRFMRERP